jgi:hypothetical protein
MQPTAQAVGIHELQSKPRSGERTSLLVHPAAIEAAGYQSFDFSP